MADRGAAADADEQPRPRQRRAPRGPGGLRRHRQGGAGLAVVRRHRPLAARPRGRRDAARAVGQAGRRHAHPRVGAARADRQLQPRRRLGQLGGVPPARGPRADDVRPDDGRVVDLHRHPGHPPGHVRDVRRDRGQEVRRVPGRHDHRHRRPRRHGRCAAARRDDERRRRDLHRVRPAPHRPPPRDALPRRAGARPRPRDRARSRGTRRAPWPLDRRARQRRRPAARAARAPPRPRRGRRSAHRHRHRPDLGARPALLPPRRHVVRRLGARAHRGPARVHQAQPGVHGPPRARDGRAPGRRRRGLRLRQLDPRRGPQGRLRPGVRVPRLRAGLHPAALLRGQGPLPLGRAVRRPRGHLRHRPRDQGAVPGGREAGVRPPARVARHGGRAGAVPGPAGPHLLAGLRRPREGGREVQRDGRQRRAQAPRS